MEPRKIEHNLSSSESPKICFLEWMTNVRSIYSCVGCWNFLPTELRTIKYKTEKQKRLINEHLLLLYKECPTFYKNHIRHGFQLLR